MNELFAILEKVIQPESNNVPTSQHHMKGSYFHDASFINDDNKDIVKVIALPGVKQEDIDFKYNEDANELGISFRPSLELDKKFTDGYLMEPNVLNYSIPDGYDPKSISPSLSNGMLYLQISPMKKPESKIKINFK